MTMNRSLTFMGGTPFKEFNRLQRRLERFFNDFGFQPNETDNFVQAFQPRSEILEDQKNYYVKLDLPGVPKDAIKIEMNENRLKIHGERKEEKKEGEPNYHFSEVFYGSFMRSFTFPSPVDSQKIQAQYDHGVLSVTVPKSSESKTRLISVQ